MEIKLTTPVQVAYHLDTGKTVIFTMEKGFGFLRVDRDKYEVVIQPEGGGATTYTHDCDEEGKNKLVEVIKDFMSSGMEFAINDDVTIKKIRV